MPTRERKQSATEARHKEKPMIYTGATKINIAFREVSLALIGCPYEQKFLHLFSNKDPPFTY